MREFINIVEAAAALKARPNARDIARIRNMRERIRADEGGGGYCHWVSEWIQNEYGWDRGSGVVLAADGEPAIVGHLWNILPDGSIFDATADQIGWGHDIRIIPPSHPDHGLYRLEYDCDYHPGHPDIPEIADTPWSGEFDMERANRLRVERGRYWYVTHPDQHAEYLRQQDAYEKGYETENGRKSIRGQFGS